MMIGLDQAAINLFVALTCGAVIGSERQMRQRMAGLRTNALVALGAAGFVIFSQLFPAEVSPTRVAAQIASGIGFLGAGIIFRDGFNIHGLNTAATLWCAAGVGMMAGASAWPFALLMTAMVVFVNLGLRPLVRWIKRKANAGDAGPRQFQVTVTVPPAAEPQARSLMLRLLPLGGLHLTEITLRPTAAGNEVDLTATLTGDGVADGTLEQAVQHLAAEPGLTCVRWQAMDEV